MRSEKELVTSGRERRIVEIQFRDLPREQDGVSANPKPKEEKKEIFTKVVIRRLPPSLSKDQLEEQISPLPAYDYFEFFSADQSLYPHLFSRAYINFKNPEDIVLFRDRFDGYVFIDNKGQEYPAVVEFAPFQKVSKKKLKKKDAKAGSIEEDPEYRRFLESYCCDEEKTTANPETLLGEIEAKTRELIAKRTTPLLEYIKNKKLEKQRIREEKREERRRREQEKKRQREEEKRKRREEERRKRKEAEKQKKLAEKEIKIKLLKKSDRDDDPDSDRLKDRGDSGDTERNRWDKSSGHMKAKHLEKEAKDKSQAESDKEQRDHGRRLRDKDPDRHRGRDEERKRQRHHYEFDKFMRHKEETKWGKGYCQDRAKKDSHHHNYSFCPDTGDKLGKDDREDMGSRKERIRNKDRPAMQLYQPGAHSRTRAGSGGKGYDCFGNSPERGGEPRYEMAMGTGSEKSGDE
ncbi:regulator of nonsense transcripts 3A isoform X2 [Megalops cyprinoides]|uniref:regulator of nonsense transcripts 3A isoform X2 n=1 Tax=Megalops cyprinoides TaxID=118141 RepID=UPI001864A85D|nr:regulator of nonsense transcripts 3A isoform X2 [Megalops cyprinoides]